MHACVPQEMVNVAYSNIDLADGEAHLAVPMARANIIAHAIDENTKHQGSPYKVGPLPLPRLVTAPSLLMSWMHLVRMR